MGALLAEQEEIVAMQARMEKVSSNKLKSTTKRKNASTNDKTQRKKTDDKWKHVKPKEGNPKMKEIQQKMWHWCPHHGEEGMWMIHSPEQCRNNPKNKEVKTNTAEFPIGNESETGSYSN